MPTYPYAHGCGPNPNPKPWEIVDKYWKYQNADPSTVYYAAIVADEFFHEMQDKISIRGKEIYGVRPEAIIVQDLRHEVIRQLAKMLNEDVKEIDQYERENSGDIRNYFVSEEEGS